MDSQFSAYPEWLVGRVATLASITVLLSAVAVFLMLVTSNMQLKLVQQRLAKLADLDLASLIGRWVKTPQAAQELDLEQGLAEHKMQKRRKHRSKRHASKFFTLSSDSQSEHEEDEQHKGPYDLEDDAWLVPSRFIGDTGSTASLSPRSDVFSLDDNMWCSVPVRV